jgi:uncharacterized membrane protein YkvA (DUF1232 family)
VAGGRLPVKEDSMTQNHLAEEFVEEEGKKVTQEDIEKVVQRSEEIKKRFKPGGPLGRFVEDGRLLVSMVKDYTSRRYRQVPYATLGSVVVALLYVLNPLDLVPDVLPLIGQVDDAVIIAACLTFIEQDLYKYRTWKENQGNPPKGELERR